jgi:hypothetical protein
MRLKITAEKTTRGKAYQVKSTKEFETGTNFLNWFENYHSGEFPEEELPDTLVMEGSFGQIVFKRMGRDGKE